MMIYIELLVYFLSIPIVFFLYIKGFVYWIRNNGTEWDMESVKQIKTLGDLYKVFDSSIHMFLLISIIPCINWISLLVPLFCFLKIKLKNTRICIKFSEYINYIIDVIKQIKI